VSYIESTHHTQVIAGTTHHQILIVCCFCQERAGDRLRCTARVLSCMPTIELSPSSGRVDKAFKQQGPSKHGQRHVSVRVHIGTACKTQAGTTAVSEQEPHRQFMGMWANTMTEVGIWVCTKGSFLRSGS
jgi:hypothetical protein